MNLASVPCILLLLVAFCSCQDLVVDQSLGVSVVKTFDLVLKNADYQGNIRNVTAVSGAVFPHTSVVIPSSGSIARQDLCLYTSFCVGDGLGKYYLIRYTPWYSCEQIDGQPLGLLRMGGVVNGQRTSHIFTSSFNCSVSVWDVLGNYFDTVGVVAYFTEHVVFCDPADDDTIIEVPLEETDWCSSPYMEFPHVGLYNTGIYGYLGSCGLEQVNVQFAGKVSHIDLICSNNGVNTSFPVACSGDSKLSICADNTVPACEAVHYGPYTLQYQGCEEESSQHPSTSIASSCSRSGGVVFWIRALMYWATLLGIADLVFA